jgi:Family of unknown function (DUF6427)
MLELFRTNQLIANIFLVVYAALFRLPAFLMTLKWEAVKGGALSHLFLTQFDTSTIAMKVFGVVLVILQAVLINWMSVRHRLSGESTMFPGLFYVLLSGFIPEFMLCSGPMLANTFFIIALFNLFDIYKKTACADTIFNVGFWLGLSSLFYFSFTIFVIFGIVGVSILRGAKLEEYLMIIAGYVVPYILAIAGFYLWGNLDNFVQWQYRDGFDIIPTFAVNFDWIQWLKVGFFGLLVLVSVISYNIYTGKRAIQGKKYLDILYWCMIFAGLATFIQGGLEFEHFLLLVVPLSLLIAFNFMAFKNRYIAEALHLAMVITGVIFQYFI